MDQLTIRKATQADLEKLLIFEQGLITAERPFDPTFKKEYTLYDLEKMVNSTFIELAVAIINEEIIGCGYARIETAEAYVQHSHHAYLGFMYVDPAWRGRSVNMAIMDYLKQWAISKGLKELRLDVYTDNQPAINAYVKAGFAPLKLEMRMGL